MAFYLPLPQVSVKLEKNFVIDEVRTKSSLGHKNTPETVRKRYEQKIKDGSDNFSPDMEKTYFVCVRTTCYKTFFNKKRKGGLPDADNVAKAIIDVLFPGPSKKRKGDSIDIVKGMQAEGEIINDKNEQSEIYIYSILCQRQKA